MPTQITNLKATVNGTSVTLSWSNPSGTARNLIFRDGVMIDDTATGITSYVDSGVHPGAHTYGVVLIGNTANIAVTVGVVPPPPGMSPPAGYGASQLIFDDQFAGTALDTTKWNAWLGGQGGQQWNNAGLPAGWSGTGHTGQTAYDPSLAVVNNGLSLNMVHDETYASLGYHTRGACICTMNRATFGPNFYAQVKAKMPDCSQGQWPAIWLLPNASTGGSEEIDIHEGGMAYGYGYANGTPINEAFAPNYHTPSGAQPLVLSDTTPVVPDLTGWHTYGMELNAAAQTVKFYIDGALYATQTGNVPSEQWELIINLCEVASGVGLWHQPCPTNMATLPASFMSVAEVQVYS